MNKPHTPTARSALLVSLFQEGNADFQVKPRIGGVFELKDTIAESVIIDSDTRNIRVGIPSEMRALIDEPWMGWGLVDGKLAFVGLNEARDYTFQLRLPIKDDLLSRLEQLEKPIALGELELSEDDSLYEIHTSELLLRLPMAGGAP